MIYKKLLEFQKLGIKVKKVGKNDFHKSTYATINEVLDKVVKPLNEMNILILQQPEATGLKTTLIDLSDDSRVECFMPYVEIGTAQKLGSNNTYLRRYSLVTILGLEDEDDDGNMASGFPSQQFQKSRTFVKKPYYSGSVRSQEYKEEVIDIDNINNEL